jgi:hypothetical protein
VTLCHIFYSLFVTIPIMGIILPTLGIMTRYNQNLGAVKLKGCMIRLAINQLLDLIARGYVWVYHKLMQRPKDQPITAQASRIEQRWPVITWGVALLIFGVSAQFREWWVIPTIIIYLFAWWWCPHITAHQRAHPENKPYSILDWATKRLGGNNANVESRVYIPGQAV